LAKSFFAAGGFFVTFLATQKSKEVTSEI